MHNTGTNREKGLVKVPEGINAGNQEGSNLVSIHDRILELKNEIETKFIKLGAYLKLVNDKKLYKEKGYDTFNEYIAMPELSFQRSTAYAIIGVYEDFIESKLSETLDIRGISYYKLDRIRQFKSESIEVMQEWVGKAKALSLSDLNAEIREVKGEPEITRDNIPEKKVYPVVCPKCGKKFEFII